MTPPLALIPVAPTGSHESVAFVNPPPPTGGLQRVTVQDYPPSPCGEALLNTRLGFDLGLRAAADVLGLRAVDLSALEHGRATLSADDWCRAWAALAADWRRRNPPRGLDLAGGRGRPREAANDNGVVERLKSDCRALAGALAHKLPDAVWVDATDGVASVGYGPGAAWWERRASDEDALRGLRQQLTKACADKATALVAEARWHDSEAERLRRHADGLTRVVSAARESSP